jgi:hypothetical protein
VDIPNTPEQPDNQQSEPQQPPANPPAAGQWPAYPAPQGEPPPYPAPLGAPAAYPPPDPNQAGAYQYPLPGQPGAYVPAPGQQGWGQPPAPKSRKKLYLIGGAIVVVAALVGGGLALFGGDDSSSAASPGDVVTTYLNDLAKGDAAGALALGPKPANTALLTDAVLKKQQAIAKISNVKVVKSDTGTYEGKQQAVVQVTYDFGPQHADVNFGLVKVSGKWQMHATVISFEPSGGSVPGLTIFGVDVSKSQKVYVFPGPLEYSSANPNIKVTVGGKEFATDPEDLAYSDLQADLSDTGKAAALTAVKSALAACAKSKSLEVEACDLYEGGYGVPDADAVENSATWSAPTDLSGVEFRLDVDESGAVSATVDAQLTWKVTYRAKNFLNNKVSTGSDTVKGYLAGTIDLSKSPAVFTPR